MKNPAYRRFYLWSLTVLLALSAYPLYMGVKTVSMYIGLGYIDANEYPKYVIPYMPMCVGILSAAALMPLAFRYAKRYALPAATSLGLAVFAALEYITERIPIGNMVSTTEIVPGTIQIVRDGAESTIPLEAWQLTLCRSLTPEEIKGQTRVVENIVFAENNPAFKFHFYIITAVIFLAVVFLVYSYGRMIRDQNHGKRRLLNVQLACTAAFVGLCVLACFTAFYRTGDIRVSPVSALLMCLFFTVFGVTFGSYLGCLFYGKTKMLSVWTPVICSMLMTAAMYAGELMLMGGELFILGSGFLFEGIGGMPFATADVLVILLSGGVTWVLMRWLNGGGKTVQSGVSA